MNPQYEILAKCLLPTHMLEWFELTNVEVKPIAPVKSQVKAQKKFSLDVEPYSFVMLEYSL